MGRLLGSHADENELDRPDLNKCPDCGCFFASDNCPLCKKPCPENMRAGVRKAEKKKKDKSIRRSRVTFVEWYHSWWFIILMTFVFPLASIFLLITSPHEKWKKIVFIAISVVCILVSSVGIGNIIMGVAGLLDNPVDTSLSQSEYIAASEKVTAEEFYRASQSFEDKKVCLTLKVVCRSAYTEGTPDGTYYICRDRENSNIVIIVRDCLLADGQNLVSGDIITLYGEYGGDCVAYDAEYFTYQGPCINMAYCKTE